MIRKATWIGGTRLPSTSIEVAHPTQSVIIIRIVLVLITTALKVGIILTGSLVNSIHEWVHDSAQVAVINLALIPCILLILRIAMSHRCQLLVLRLVLILLLVSLHVLIGAYQVGRIAELGVDRIGRLVTTLLVEPLDIVWYSGWLNISTFLSSTCNLLLIIWFIEVRLLLVCELITACGYCVLPSLSSTFSALILPRLALFLVLINWSLVAPRLRVAIPVLIIQSALQTLTKSMQATRLTAIATQSTKSQTREILKTLLILLLSWLQNGAGHGHELVHVISITDRAHSIK